MSFLRKNQFIIGAVALMLIAAGYLNFTNEKSNINTVIESGALADSEQIAEIGDAKLVSSLPSEENSNTIEKDTNVVAENVIAEEKDLNTDKIEKDEYFTKSRLERETMYSQTKESYQKILNNTNISETQKSTASKEIKRINDEENAIMIAENLIKTKGFEDVIIFVNDKSINVIVKSSKLKTEQIAQIQNIITRELDTKIQNIHISNKE